MSQRFPQGYARNFDKSVKRAIKLQNYEDRNCDTERRDYDGELSKCVSWGTQSKANEDHEEHQNEHSIERN